MLVYGAAGLICTVDYSHQRSAGTKVMGAVRHSGDIMNQAESEGKQTMSVTFADLVGFVPAFSCNCRGGRCLKHFSLLNLPMDDKEK